MNIERGKRDRDAERERRKGERERLRGRESEIWMQSEERKVDTERDRHAG